MSDIRDVEGREISGKDLGDYNISGIQNYYGRLHVKEENSKCFWMLEDYDVDRWKEIPRYLFDALNRYQDEEERK